MKITDISPNQIQELEDLSNNEAIDIVGGDRGGSSDPCPPMVGSDPGTLSSGGMIEPNKYNGNKTLASFDLSRMKRLVQLNKT